MTRVKKELLQDIIKYMKNINLITNKYNDPNKIEPNGIKEIFMLISSMNNKIDSYKDLYHVDLRIRKLYKPMLDDIHSKVKDYYKKYN